ncbi:hypothetical protein CEP54_016252 [Fusarium duplospermum]|uniref:Uncharacterized protein n=1 Tax=Fusarium duplospermum TaxID=1325734 RepID=A0A428NGI5_9HYPO|nr:hypothetical protein CEP54_016252 [Fusarium duplospermum]
MPRRMLLIHLVASQSTQHLQEALPPPPLGLMVLLRSFVSFRQEGHHPLPNGSYESLYEVPTQANFGLQPSLQGSPSVLQECRTLPSTTTTPDHTWPTTSAPDGDNGAMAMRSEESTTAAGQNEEADRRHDEHAEESSGSPRATSETIVEIDGAVISRLDDVAAAEARRQSDAMECRGRGSQKMRQI